VETNATFEERFSILRVAAVDDRNVGGRQRVREYLYVRTLQRERAQCRRSADAWYEVGRNQQHFPARGPDLVRHAVEHVRCCAASAKRLARIVSDDANVRRPHEWTANERVDAVFLREHSSILG